jgi:putative ATP-binding cassette transporter
MHILKVLQKQSRLFLPYVLLLGIINSVVYSGLLAFVNYAVKGASIPFVKGNDYLLYISLVVASLLCTKIFQTYMVKLTHKLLLHYELSILQQVRQATYQAFEKLGAERIYTAIGDVRILAYIPEVLVAVVNSSVIILCALGYLCWVSPVGGLSVLGLMAVLLSVYMIRNARIEKDLNRVRDMQNDYHTYLRDLVYGFKEIKMSSTRNDNIYHRYIRTNRLEGKELGSRSAVKFLDNELIGTYSWYLALGVVIFALPQWLHLSAIQTVPFVVVILYLMGPLASLVKIIPYYTNVKIALERIDAIKAAIDEAVPEQATTAALPETAFESIDFIDVTFGYFDSKDQLVFKTGPFNLSIRKGETIFITGGNGSGKSTFINLLTGLYRPLEGAICFNGHTITAENYTAYSDRISAIFTHAYLFNENYDGFDLSSNNARLVALIEKMRLQAVIRLGTDRNFIDTGLSKGQQKRLALIYAMMEDREVLVLDEWAAEQDPAFRAYFYKHLIPEMQQKGKTIIAVTHDDAYFNHAGRMLRFDYGKIVEDRRLFHQDNTSFSLDLIANVYEQ